MEHSTQCEDAVRVHLQSFISDPAKRIDLRNGRWREFTFDGVVPSHISKTNAPNGARRKIKSDDLTGGDRAACAAVGRLHEAHYYFAYPKIGALYRWSSLRPWVDYFPTPRWILNAVRSRKMTPRDGIIQLRESRTPCSRTIEEVEKMVDRLAEDEDLADERRVHKLHESDLLPFVPAPEPVAEALRIWERVRRKEGIPPKRFRPIVIGGDTRCGKSSWALSVYGAARTLQVNCQEVQEPALRHFRRRLHDAIIFEEATWKLVYYNKMLFQAGNSAVDFGRSATNCHHFRKRFFGVPMFILGNEFFKGIEANPDAEKYVRPNVVYWDVPKGTRLYA